VVRLVDNIVVASGEIEAAESEAFAASLVAAAQRVIGPLLFELDELDLEDGVSVARTISALRLAAAGRSSVTLRNAPQMLAHTLYKVGMLDTFTLIDPRHDEGHGAS